MKQLNFEDITALTMYEQFYEKTGIETTLYKVVQAPKVQNNSDSKSLLWIGIDKKGEVVEFLLTSGLEHYGPEIFA